MATSRSSLAFFLSIATTALLAPGSHASAYSIRTIYSFCRQGGSNCTDGGGPRGRLLEDASGNLYGVTATGGGGLSGTIFELIPAHHGAWKHKILHSFCVASGCPDGAAPDSGLIADISGNLYGTTPAGGKYDQGIAYELTPNATRTRWRLKVLHDFCPGGDPHCPDGAFTAAPLTYDGAASGALYDGTSALYGVAPFGGASEWGTVFRIQPVTGKKIWSLRTLYNFCAQPNCADGASPLSGLPVDGSGNLLGTTASGQGSGNSGVVFELVPNAKKTKWSETVLHSFCSVGNCLDGAFPSGGVVMDASGDLFGGTSEGGSGTAKCGGSFGCGVVYKIVPNGAASQETVLYNFCSFADCADGDGPAGDLLVDASGNLLGATAFGGGNDTERGGAGGGTLFLSNEGHTVLYSFCAQSNCADGAQPLGDMIMDGAGNIFGIASVGGAIGLDSPGGTVFELSP